jgi:hypothetical protein
MKRIAVFALTLLVPAAALLAADKKPGISISFSSDDSHTAVGSRHPAADARLAITTRDGSTTLMLLKDVVAVQLTDRTIANVHASNDAGFVEELLASTVRLTMGKSVEYPIANIRSADLRDGALLLINDQNKPLFSELKVNGTEVLHDFSAADVARFVNAFRAAKAARR